MSSTFPSEFLPRRSAIAFLVGAVLVSCLAAGCQRRPPRARISGTVSYKGEPVAFGDIVFEPTEAWKEFYCQGQIIDGKYSIEQHGPVVGKNRVEIHGFRQSEQLVPDIAGRRLDEKPTMAKGLIPYIPAEYNDMSQLSIDVAAGANVNIDFDLK
jgi:hypothetical protein